MIIFHTDASREIVQYTVIFKKTLRTVALYNVKNWAQRKQLQRDVEVVEQQFKLKML